MVTGLDADAELAGAPGEPGDQRTPAADHVAGLGPDLGDHTQEALPHEGGRQSTGVSIEGEDAGRFRRQVGGGAAAVLGDPVAELSVERRLVAGQLDDPQERRRWRAPELPAVAEADAPHGRARLVARQPALDQPGPHRPVVVDDMGAEVCPERSLGGAGPSSERAMGLEEPHPGAALGATDGGDEPTEPASDDRDLVHASKEVWRGLVVPRCSARRNLFDFRLLLETWRSSSVAPSGVIRRR